MNDKGHIEKLGPPILEIAGLRVWIHSRQFPEAQDYYDGNWLNVTVNCAASGASVWVHGAIVAVTDISSWIQECESLYENHAKQAELRPCEPNLFVSITPTDKAGHMTMHVEITPDNLTQEHKFDFAIDQSYLPHLITQCRGIVKEFGIRGKRP